MILILIGFAAGVVAALLGLVLLVAWCCWHSDRDCDYDPDNHLKLSPAEILEVQKEMDGRR